MLHLVDKKNMSREDAYALVQKLAHELKPGEHLKDKILKDKKAAKLFSKGELNEIFSGRKHLAMVEKRMKVYFKA